MANQNYNIADQLQEKLIARLTNISKRASFRRHLDDSISGAYADELKARAFMFQEAADLVATLPATGSALDFFRAVSGGEPFINIVEIMAEK